MKWSRTDYCTARCDRCEWEEIQRPGLARFHLGEHVHAVHPGMLIPPKPDEYAVRRGEWEYAAWVARRSRLPRDMITAANLSLRFSDYLEHAGLKGGPSDPFHLMQLEGERLIAVWNAEAEKVPADSDAIDKAFHELLEFLGSSKY